MCQVLQLCLHGVNGCVCLEHACCVTAALQCALPTCQVCALPRAKGRPWALTMTLWRNAPQAAARSLLAARRPFSLHRSMQDGITDLEEDTRQKLTQTWDALSRRVEAVRGDLSAARAELTEADATMVDLAKALGDKLDAVQLTELPDVNAQLAELAASVAAEQEGMRKFVDEALQVRHPLARPLPWVPASSLRRSHQLVD